LHGIANERQAFEPLEEVMREERDEGEAVEARKPENRKRLCAFRVLREERSNEVQGHFT
jgi:hypothetical protein